MLSIESYTVAAYWFVRLLGAVYFFAFSAFLLQIKGLIGSKGILPLSAHLNMVKLYYKKNAYKILPTIFWLNSSDTALMLCVATGTCLSILLFLGFYPPLMLLGLYVLYLSIVSAGQDFLGFGWEGFLLETTVNAFLLSLTHTPTTLVWISLNLLLFRFHFQAGAVKIQSRDVNWRNLTAIYYHYQSQPIPNAFAWYIHKMPMWFHKLSTVLMFIIELIVPFGILGTDLMRLIAFILFFGLQWSIWITGNFSFLNHLTTVLSIILVSNAYFPSWLTPHMPSVPDWEPLSLFCNIMGGVLITLQCMQLWQHFFPNALFHVYLNKLGSFHLINRYGIFAVMTTTRNEVVIEGSEDGETWKEYCFYFKPSDTGTRPMRISPFQPRLDWQIWFLPFSSHRNDLWLQKLLYHLLVGTPEVLKLLKTNPFATSPPLYVRTLMYEYTFTSFAQRRATGQWWQREYRGIFSDAVCLKMH